MPRGLTQKTKNKKDKNKNKTQKNVRINLECYWDSHKKDINNVSNMSKENLEIVQKINYLPYIQLTWV